MLSINTITYQGSSGIKRICLKYLPWNFKQSFFLPRTEGRGTSLPNTCIYWLVDTLVYVLKDDSVYRLARCRLCWVESLTSWEFLLTKALSDAALWPILKNFIQKRLKKLPLPASWVHFSCCSAHIWLGFALPSISWRMWFQNWFIRSSVFSRQQEFDWLNLYTWWNYEV